MNQSISKNNLPRLYSVSKRDLIRTLEEFYRKVDKTKLKNVKKIADKYYMNQIQLFGVLEKKYNNEKVILHVSKYNKSVLRVGILAKIPFNSSSSVSTTFFGLATVFI